MQLAIQVALSAKKVFLAMLKTKKIRILSQITILIQKMAKLKVKRQIVKMKKIKKNLMEKMLMECQKTKVMGWEAKHIRKN